MRRRDWIRCHKKTVAAATLGLALMVAVALGIWFGWDLKTLIGWRALVDYINPKDARGRKDAVQVYAVIVAGVVAAITAAVGLLNLRLTRRNLEQQRELEAQRAQGTALQAYYEQIGKLLTDKDLLNTQRRKEISELARGQTLTVLQEVDGKGKGSLPTFLHGAGLIGRENPAVALTGADLRGAYLRGAYGIMQYQVELTIGSSETKLPEGINRPEFWSKSPEEQKNIHEQREQHQPGIRAAPIVFSGARLASNAFLRG